MTKIRPCRAVDVGWIQDEDLEKIEVRTLGKIPRAKEAVQLLARVSVVCT
jgi:hypothetical protein